MFGYDVIWAEITRELAELSQDFAIWTSRMSGPEKVIVLCLFIIFLFALTVRIAGGKKRDRSELFQFGFAMALVIMFGFAAGWMFTDTPDFLLMSL